MSEQTPATPVGSAAGAAAVSVVVVDDHAMFRRGVIA